MLKNRLDSCIYFHIGLNTKILVRKRTVKYHSVTSILVQVSIIMCTDVQLVILWNIFFFFNKTNAHKTSIMNHIMSYSHTIKGLRAVLNLKSEGEIWKMYGQYMKCVVWKEKRYISISSQFQTKLQLPANLCSREKLCHIACHF